MKNGLNFSSDNLAGHPFHAQFKTRDITGSFKDIRAISLAFMITVSSDSNMSTSRGGGISTSGILVGRRLKISALAISFPGL
ncbi:hypothetical protein T10_9488 [Trichinella papuae]|uniref:Uncharacterized protein n=1 Tax=Trichinella papuae TaxID=268474 RepID=A0A0V1N1C6_9BILA|nr:hypothetical protein T10_9488 [Trichinella papuae]